MVKNKFSYKGQYVENVAIVGMHIKIGGSVGKRYGFIDANEKLIIDCKYHAVTNFKNGLARVRMNTKVGIIDKRGNLVAPIEYTSIGPYIEGLSKVSKIIRGKNVYGFLDRTGKEIIKPQFDDVTNFYKDIALAKKGLKSGVIDSKGEIQVAFDIDKDIIKELLKNTKVNVKKVSDSRLRLICISKDGRKIVEYTLLQESTGRMATCNEKGLADLVHKYGSSNIKIDKVLGVVGTECSLNRIPTIQLRGNSIEIPKLIVLAKIVVDNYVCGYRVYDFMGRIWNLPKEDLIEIAKYRGLSNAKLSQGNIVGLRHAISSLTGNYV